MSLNSIGGHRPSGAALQPSPTDSGLAPEVPAGSDAQATAAPPLQVADLVQAQLPPAVPLDGLHAEVAQPMELPAGVDAEADEHQWRTQFDSIKDQWEAQTILQNAPLGDRSEDISAAISQARQLNATLLQACDLWMASYGEGEFTTRVSTVRQDTRASQEILSQLELQDYAHAPADERSLLGLVNSMKARIRSGEVDIAARQQARIDAAVQAIKPSVEGYFNPLHADVDAIDDARNAAVGQALQMGKAAKQDLEQTLEAYPAFEGRQELENYLEIVTQHLTILQALQPEDWQTGQADQASPKSLMQVIESMAARIESGELDVTARQQARLDAAVQAVEPPLNAYDAHLLAQVDANDDAHDAAIEQALQLGHAAKESLEHFLQAHPAFEGRQEFTDDLNRMTTQLSILKALQPQDRTSGQASLNSLSTVIESVQARMESGEIDITGRPTPARYTLAGFNAEEARLLQDSALGVAGGKMLKAHAIPITADTVAGLLRPAKQVGEMTTLGAGAFNTTYTVRIAPGDPPAERVFKPVLTPEAQAQAQRPEGLVAATTGIDRLAPRFAQRNLSTCAVDGRLGFHVVVTTELGVGTPPPPPPDAPPTLGLVMEKAAGETGADADRALFDTVQGRQKLLQLQLLDHLAAQGDRHANNYMIWRDARGQIQVRGIDNDQCWGRVPRDGNAIARTSIAGFWGTLMPPVVDEETAAALRGLTPEELNALLTARGMTAEECEAAQARLASIKTHLDTLASSTPSRIVPLARLADADITARFTERNSYIGRELADKLIS